MTVLFKELAPLINEGGNRFYLWQEITETNQCKAKHCPDFALECVNDGFVSYVEGKCRCLCPPGLDHTTGCRNVIKDVPTPDVWPFGSFGVFSASGACPSELSPLEFQTETELFGQSSNFHLGGNITDEGVDILMCMQDSNSSKEENVAWLTGQYCVLVNNVAVGCPQKFTVTNISIPGFEFAICCRDDGYTGDVIYLPKKTPFVLLPLDIDGPCQSVQGMFGVLESLELQVIGTTVKLPSKLPIKVSGKTHVTLGFCYYVQYETDCGGVIDMSREMQSTVITSPGHPAPYKPALDCYWLIKGPPNSTIVLDFDDFDVGDKTEDCEGDFIIVRYALLGQNSFRHCGKKMDQTFRTIENAMTLNFHSNIRGQHRGFNATVRVILPEAYCYNVADRGASYRGQINFTRDYQPCLPWDRVTECSHHMFNSRDFDGMLEKNYCRNPDNSFRPWCYTKTYEGQCERNYCDVCRLEKAYDNFPDCEQQKKDDLCEKDPNLALSRCAKTCAVPLPQREESSSCGRPPIIHDALLTFERSWYDVGDTVSNKCPYGPDTITRRCHSDGSWSPANYVCGVCSNDWFAHNGACYRFFPQLLDHTAAVDFCALHNSILSPATSLAEVEFVVSLRPMLRRMWLGATRRKGSRTWWTTDNRRLDLDNWSKGGKTYYNQIECAIIDTEQKNNNFKREDCFAFRPFVCKRFPTPRRVCVNRRWDCHSVVRRNPNVCFKYPDFAWQQCPFTCGLCQPFLTPFCTVMPPGVNLVANSNMTYISRADVITYECKPGTVLVEGDLIRICEDSGWLSGKEPICIDENEVVTPNNMVALVSRGKIGLPFRTYIGNNSLHRINREGEITQWRFFAKGYGNAYLQVWRPRPDLGPLEFEFIGQNLVQTEANRVSIVDIPPTERIRVLPGDLIGQWAGNRTSLSQIVFSECGSQTNAEANDSLVLTQSIYSAKYIHIGEVSTAKEPTCRTFSLTAFVNGTQRLLSRTSAIPLTPGKTRISQSSNKVYTGNNSYFRIRANGSLIEWQLYSQSPGKIALQVWRPRPGGGRFFFSLEFIGQNMVETGSYTKQVISVPRDEQVEVKENDVIGVWFRSPPGMLSYERCNKDNNPLALPLLYMKFDSDFVQGSVYNFSLLAQECRTFPLIAIIEEDQ